MVRPTSRPEPLSATLHDFRGSPVPFNRSDWQGADPSVITPFFSIRHPNTWTPYPNDTSHLELNALRPGVLTGRRLGTILHDHSDLTVEPH